MLLNKETSIFRHPSFEQFRKTNSVFLRFFHNCLIFTSIIMLLVIDLKKLRLTLITKKMPLLKQVITYQVASYQFHPKLENFVCTDFWCNANKLTVVFTSSRLTEMKFCTAYKLFINYILRLHVKRFTPATPARRDPSFVCRDLA